MESITKIVYGLLLLGAVVLSACVIQDEIVEPISVPSTPVVQLSEEEVCVQEGKLWFYETVADEFSCIEKSENIIQCENSGGEWRMFNNGCKDSCGLSNRLCTQAFAVGCDCGPTQCYGDLNSPCDAPEGVTCLSVIRLGCKSDVNEPYATLQEACQTTGGVWDVSTGTRCPTIEECMIDDNSEKVCGCPVEEVMIDTSTCQCPEDSPFWAGKKGCSEQEPTHNALLSIIDTLGG